MPIVNRSATTLFTLGLIAFGPVANANLAAIGPVDPDSNFPGFVQDSAEVQLGPCDRVDPVNEDGDIVNNTPCGGLELFDPNGDFVEGNIAEFTYYRAEANIVDGTPNGERFRLRMEVQGGVLPPESINNAIRVRLRNLVLTGRYRLTTPFGQFDFNVSQADLDSGVDEELPGGGLGITPNYTQALSGNIACFWPNNTQVQVGGQTFLGDGLTEQPLVPVDQCPQGAGELILRVEFPDGTIVETDLFAVEGRLLDQAGIIPQRATYERNVNGTVARVDVWAASISGQDIEVAGEGLRNNLRMAEDAAGPGSYNLRQRLLPSGIDVPDSISIGGVTAALVDEVTITRARFNVNNGTLEIRAASSDRSSADTPTLTAFDQGGNELGTLVGGQLLVNIDVPASTITPRKITVESSAGGTDTEIVDVLGGNVTQ